MNDKNKKKPTPAQGAQKPAQKTAKNGEQRSARPAPKNKKNTPAPIEATEKPKAPTHLRKKQKSGKKPLVTTHGPREKEKKEQENMTSLPSRRAPRAPAIIHDSPMPESVKATMKDKTPLPRRGEKGKNPLSRHTGAPKPGAKLRVISLGGLHEVGKNMTAIEYGDDIIVVDSGFGFPDEDMLGVDYVIPDITYLEKNAHRVRGILITHCL